MTRSEDSYSQPHSPNTSSFPDSYPTFAHLSTSLPTPEPARLVDDRRLRNQSCDQIEEPRTPPMRHQREIPQAPTSNRRHWVQLDDFMAGHPGLRYDSRSSEKSRIASTPDNTTPLSSQYRDSGWRFPNSLQLLDTPARWGVDEPSALLPSWIPQPNQINSPLHLASGFSSDSDMPTDIRPSKHRLDEAETNSKRTRIDYHPEQTYNTSCDLRQR